MTAIGGLRRARLGKFEGGLFINQYVYDLTLEGWGDGTGDVSEIGVYYSSVELGPEALKRVEEIVDEEGDKLTPEERALIIDSYGAIVSENDQGFVSVDYYEDQESFEDDWKRIEKEIDEIYEGQESEEG